MNQKITKTLVAALLGIVCAISATAVNAATAPRDPLNGRQSYSGSNMSCLIANDFYAVHFTALQTGRQKGEKTPFEKYCQEIPAAGKTYLTVDLLDRDVRNTPIALRVVEENLYEDGRAPEIKRTLNETAPKIYKNGSADIQVEIPQSGHYALIVTVGDDAITEDDRLRIPFSVGLPAPTSYSNLYGKFSGGLAFLFYGVIGVIGYRVYRLYRPKQAGLLGDKAGAGANLG